MSLATRCTACGTVFRIVEDQLRVSDGWVRCGRCAEIFDARELLFDIEREAPPPWPTAFVAPPEEEPVEPPPPPPPPPSPPPAPAPVFEEPPVWMPPPEPEPRVDALPTGWPSEVARHEPRWVDEPSTPVEAPVASRSLIESALQASPPPMAAEPAAAPDSVVPEFMRHAESTARWNRPAVRAGLAAASLVLAVLLLLQVTLHFRHALAALHPPLRGALQGLCAGLGCEVKPWQVVDAFKIEATSLAEMGSGGSYKLSLTLRNKTSVEVAMPWIELKLTDAQGALLSRRVLQPALLSPALPHIGPDSEQVLTFNFSTGNQRVSGYAVEYFYP